MKLPLLNRCHVASQLAARSSQLAGSLGVALAGFAIAGDAAAMAASKVAMSGFSITLYDLNPADGIAPAIVFGPGNTSYAAASIADSVNNLYPSDYNEGGSPFAPASAAAATPNGAAKAVISGGGSPASSTAVVSGWSASPILQDTWYSAEAALLSGSFTLTPFTAIRFAADTVVGASTTFGSNGWWYETASAQAAIWVDVQRDGISEFHVAARFADATYSSVWDPGTGTTTYFGETVSNNGLLDLTFTNGSSKSLEGLLYAGAWGYGASPFPVPEPSTSAMLCAGLGVLGLIGRRRQR